MQTGTADKRRLRERMKRRRDGLSECERAACSGRISDILLSEDWYDKSWVILVYSAIRSEVDLSSFCERAWRDDKELYFPRVEQSSMEFYRVDSPAQLVRGSFSVMEPRLRLSGSEEPHTVSEANGPHAQEVRAYAGPAWSGMDKKAPVLVPGLAFSRDGGRLGYGGGYYDRYLAAHPHLMPIGVCYAAQLVGEVEKGGVAESAGADPMLTVQTETLLAMEAHDRRMDRIVTECGVWTHF